MFDRRSLRLPITLGVLMIVVLVAMIVVWVLVTTTISYWTLLTIGSILLVLMLVGVVLYLTISIKTINLNRRQSNFIDSVTHELKSPIASLKLYLQTLKLRDVTDEERQRFLKFMMDDVERLDGLINHLLDAGHIDKKPSEKQVELLNLDEIIVDCVQSVCTRYRVPRSTIELDLKPCQIRAPRVDAVMVFRNLLDNAVKYAGSPPQVKVSLRIEADKVIAEVADNGAGIPKEQRRKVFGRFVRLGKELQRKKPGTGLGLYIVSTLVRQMGGKVKVLDRGRKMGTVFEVRLPGVRRPETSTHPKGVDLKPETLIGDTVVNP